MSATGLRVDLRGSGPFSVDGFDKALNDAIGQPGDDAPWRRLEETAAADEAQSRRLLDAYRAQLVAELPRSLHEVVAHRAVGFAADCFGENAPESIDVLRAVLAAAPDADWAFRPLIVALTMGERWTDVLDAYDARLAAGRGDDQRAELLGEAARIAKDFTRDGARAIGYLDRLFRMRPLDAQVASSLERLLERERRWGELCAVWRLRLETLLGEEARALRLRLATTLHGELARPSEAVEALRPILSMLDGPDVQAGLTERLEQIFSDERAPTETRLEALDALRARLDAAGRTSRVAELLAVAIGFSQGERLRALRRECGERRRALGDMAGALEQYVALSTLLPEDHEIEDRLRQLAELSGDAAALTRGLTAAARATTVAERRVELLMRAARVEDRQPGRKAEAAALFSAAAAEEVASLDLRVEALRRLEVLHDELGDLPARLDVLERLAAAEPKPADKRLAWARVADLARGRGDVDRALGAWNGRLAVEPADGEALAASRALLLEAERWPALIELLRRRVDSAPAEHQVRADLVEIAALARTRTRELGKAVDTWREIAARFGEDDACVDALVDLLAESGRFGELGELLTQRAGVDRRVHADRLARLGDTLRLQLQDTRGAIGWYAQALEVEPAHPAARAGLSALLSDATLAPLAAAPLARAAERTDGWQLLLDLVPHRLAALENGGARARLLEEAAAIAEERAGDRARAFEWLCQALPLAGENLALGREILRLAEATGGAARAAEALAGAIAAGGWAPLPLAHLHERRGALLEESVADLVGARASYEAALALTPERLAPRRRALAMAVRLGDLSGAAALLVDAAVSPATRANVLLPLYESLARDAGLLPAAAAALAQAADQASELEPSARRELHAHVAATLFGECQDPAAADTALARALGAEPGHVATLRQRAELQRARGGDGLIETLRRLSDEQPNDLDVLREAAAVALAKSDEPLAVELLGRLAERAARLAQLGLAQLDAGSSGTEAALDAAAHAIDESVRLQVAGGGPEPLRRATAMLLEGARLPAATETRRAWLRRAAELTEHQLADTAGAIRIWRTLHEEAPADEPAREALARLYEGERRFADATSLRLARAGVDGRERATTGAAARDRAALRAAREAERRPRGPARQPGRTAGTRGDGATAGGGPAGQEEAGGAGRGVRAAGGDPGRRGAALGVGHAVGRAGASHREEPRRSPPCSRGLGRGRRAGGDDGGARRARAPGARRRRSGRGGRLARSAPGHDRGAPRGSTWQRRWRRRTSRRGTATARSPASNACSATSRAPTACATAWRASTARRRPGSRSPACWRTGAITRPTRRWSWPAPARRPRSTRASGCWRARSRCWSTPCASCRATRGCGWPWPTAWPSAAAAPKRAASCWRWSSRPGGARAASAPRSTSGSVSWRAPRAIFPARSRSSSRRRRWTPPTRTSCGSWPRWPRPPGSSPRPSAPTARCWSGGPKGRARRPPRRSCSGCSAWRASAATAARRTSCSSRRWRPPSRIPRRRAACSRRCSRAAIMSCSTACSASGSRGWPGRRPRPRSTPSRRRACGARGASTRRSRPSSSPSRGRPSATASTSRCWRWGARPARPRS